MPSTLEYAPLVVETEKWLTRADAAQLLGVSTQTVDRHANDGDLTRYRVGARAVRFRIEDVRALLRPDAPRKNGTE